LFVYQEKKKGKKEFRTIERHMERRQQAAEWMPHQRKEDPVKKNLVARWTYKVSCTGPLSFVL